MWTEDLKTFIENFMLKYIVCEARVQTERLIVWLGCWVCNATEKYSLGGNAQSHTLSLNFCWKIQSFLWQQAIVFARGKPFEPAYRKQNHYGERALKS